MTEPQSTPRRENLQRILEERRRALFEDVRHGIRESCDGISFDRADGVLDSADSSEISTQDDLRFALMHIKAELLVQINDALAHLADGRYGLCDDCGNEITEARLRALPFALRCTACEASREHEARARSDRTLKRLKQESTDFQ